MRAALSPGADIVPAILLPLTSSDDDRAIELARITRPDSLSLSASLSLSSPARSFCTHARAALCSVLASYLPTSCTPRVYIYLQRAIALQYHLRDGYIDTRVWMAPASIRSSPRLIFSLMAN